MDGTFKIENIKLCEQAYEYRTFTQMNILQYIQLLLAVISITMVLFLLRTNELKRLREIVRPSLKIVAASGILIYITGSIFSFICYAYIIVTNFLNLDACGYVWKTFDCWLIRLPMYACLVGYNTFHVSLLIERSISTFHASIQHRQTNFNRRTTNDGRLIGLSLAFFMVLIPCLITMYIFGNENLQSPRTYCLAGSVSATDRIVLFTKILFCFDFLAMSGDLFLLLFNKAQIKRRVSNYNLECAFRLREQQITIQYIFPFTLIHSISFLVYLIFFLSNRSFLNNSNFDEKQMFFYAELNSLSKALYIAVVPLGLLIYGRFRGQESKQWLRKQDTHADVYFEMFKRQIQ